MRTPLVMVSVLALAGGLLSACKIERTGETSAASSASLSGKPADPAAQVAETWNSQVLPYLEKKAGDFTAVRDQLASAPDEAGRQHGYRQKDEGVPWTIVVRASGTILDANTKSRAATANLDADGDGKAELTVQLGPVIRGTAIRDVLDFVRFEDFSNQIAYANYGKALNTQANDTVLAKLPREGLVGRRMTLLGVFTYDKPGQPPLVTPVEASVE